MKKIKEIDFMVKSIYRLIIFSRYHADDDLLDSFFNGIHGLTELVSIKNAQMEAQNEDEAKEYLKNLRIALDFIVEEIKAHRNFKKELQLSQLYRLVLQKHIYYIQTNIVSHLYKLALIHRSFYPKHCNRDWKTW